MNKVTRKGKHGPKKYTIHVGKISYSSSDDREKAVDIECHKTKTGRGSIDVIIISSALPWLQRYSSVRQGRYLALL
jgi:hypothetical protein